jgi:hypothetical protein
MAELHSSIVALVSLASGIASNHPAMGQCQLARLRHQGVSEEQIASVIEIARHIRDEAAQKLDLAFDEAAYPQQQQESDSAEQVTIDQTATDESCCSSTASGQSCC